MNRHRKNVIITDSYSVLQSLESKNWGKHDLIIEILEAAEKKNKMVVS